MESPLVSINLVVRNGEKYIRNCLLPVKNQSYNNIEVTIFDNASDDGTKEIIKKEFPQFRLIENNFNYGFGPGQNRCLKITKGKYILGLCVDVEPDRDFVKNAVTRMESDSNIGALQAKIYKMENGNKTDAIDSCGFEIYRSRRIVNRGHGEKDSGQFSKSEEIFSYEGAAPFWRRQAMEECAVFGEIHDEDYFWYSDDIDLGWRMRLFGWKSFFDPSVIAWHDRSTTKRLSRDWRDFIKLRETIPPKKRLLDWQNMHLTFIKNDLFASVLKDFKPFLVREIKLFLYILIFEPYTLLALPKIARLLPRILKKREYIMEHRKATQQEIEKWFR